MLESLSCGHVVAVASSLVDIHLAGVVARAGELVRPEAVSAGYERDVAGCMFRGSTPSEACASVGNLAHLVSPARVVWP
jgi:hypothetical protein